jgi:hypothetical protein
LKIALVCALTGAGAALTPLLIVVNDREASDFGSILYGINIANPTSPAVTAVLPLGLTGSGRGSGHIANFDKSDCSQLWVDGGDHVEVVDVPGPQGCCSDAITSSRTGSSGGRTST